MTTNLYVTVMCDECYAETDDFAPDEINARSKARGAGWIVHEGRDVCVDCVNLDARIEAQNPGISTGDLRSNT